MKRIHIFKPGKHTSSNGTTLEFSDDILRRSVEAYDPALHEAPIVVGHPADNGPAYGWVGALSYSDDDGVYAEPRQVEHQFSELVQEGRFKKVSASWYGPDAPNNPVPGTYYLRHVGFLGAQPPAIKGLKAVEFGEAEEGVIEFGEFEIATTAGVFKRLREWIIERFGREDADSVIPDWTLEDMEHQRRLAAEQEARAIEKAVAEANTPGFSEGDPEPGNADPAPEGAPAPDGDNPEQPTQPEANAMTLEEQLAAAKAELEAMKQQETNFSEREQALKAKEAEIDKANVTAQIKAHADAGRVLPADVEQLAEFAAHLDRDQVLEFSEDQKTSRRDFFLNWLAKQPARVDFNEYGGDPKDPEQEETPRTIAARITDYRERESAKGRTITYEQALRVVKAGKDLEA